MSRLNCSFSKCRLTRKRHPRRPARAAEGEAMTNIVKLLRSIIGKPPVIQTRYGEPVTEKARLQAAINMAMDASLRVKVEQIVIREMGGDVEKGLAECRRRYPEGYFK